MINNCGWGYTPHPKRTLIQGVLIHGICPFVDGTRTAYTRTLLFEEGVKPSSANSQSGLLNAHLFEAYLLTEFANSKTEYEPQGGEHMSAELDD